MKKCVVFGANGFIGSHLVGALIAAGHHVRACDVSRNFDQLRELPAAQLETMTIDFLDEVAVRDAVQGRDSVFHLVSTTLPASSNKNMVFDMESNVVGSIRLLEACAKAGVERFVFASSGGTVYGEQDQFPVPETARTQPQVSYGIAKATIEHYCRVFTERRGLKTLALRVANPYGGRHQSTAQGAIPVFLRRILKGQPIVIWGDGSIVRDYVYVNDVAKAFLLALEYAGPELVLNIGSGEGTSLVELIGLIESVVGKASNLEFQASRDFDVSRNYLDVSLASRELGWIPETSLREGIALTLTAIRAEENSQAGS